jgi:anti-sigma-K factor RskA
MDDQSHSDASGDDFIALAGEIALGLVKITDLDEKLRNDPILLREVARWVEDLAALVDELQPIAPSARVSEALRVRSDYLGGVAGDGWSGSLASWRLAVAASVAAILLLAALVVANHEWRAPPKETALLVASLSPKEGPPLFAVAYDGGERLLVVIPAAVQPEPGRTPALWFVPNDSDEPILLGRLNAEHSTKISLPSDTVQLITDNAALVITSEPTDVRSSSEPGPVIAHGRLAPP